MWDKKLIKPTRADATLFAIVAGKVWEWLCDNVAGTVPKI